ncbi:phosphoenolpyruvate--protein phosphotransferase [Escherichia coli]|uniref:phosphoenolpyruvate--protein phosphotransferase n=1 Tax=Escherichia coli TaxID=562 RepID=UPI0003EF2C88|nr:phosphoenolpyruvate--protein phosphotransferase [Escherichia coli]EFH5801071.1 phosphoenolpyruvate--protein phosphotransferase [Escherichia coli]EFH6446123.1 phosphoenolpyruvate--protein phosphotransferase [Escherichia coli]EFO5562810.1 phosphoenolpyruvate--protein phosphotransferase [Escherichia coli]EGE6923628.1 phosphoenolpyruvate--protein phosphotransferase [Escherichia coli]EGM7709447.1 phosphoenolpyruvate--protein phosphotransferase [Escherichia coli]
MVAIVIVSHSLRLAQGIEELALQMSGGDVPLAIAAGIDDPQNPIGTDAIAIMSAIESVWSPDGVLVLMDMGSALLSTEMALELLSEEQRSAIYLLAAPVVEGAMSAVTSAAAGLSVTEIIAEVDLALCAKQQQLMPSSTAGEVIPAISPVNHCDEWQTFCWTIRNPHGIHARPAASILKVSAQYSANIIVIKGDKRASTRSLNELAMLGVRCGDEIIFQAEGTDASDALKAIETLAKNHFGEAHLLASSEIPLTETPVVSAPVDGAISGLSVQNGIAIGPVKWFTCERPEITQRTVDSPQEELSRIESAIDIVVCELADKAAGPEGDIFAAHKMMLEDPEITRQLQQRLAKGKQAEFAWLEVMQALAEQYCQAETLYLREREADIRDLTRQVLNQLCGVSEQHFITTAPCILLANDLLPSQITSLNKAHILGICLHNGGTTSHTAILARAMVIPAIAKAAITPQNVRDNDTVILDGETGRLWLQPDEVTRLDLLQRAEAWRQQRDRQLADAMLPAVTQGGRNISVLANIGDLQDIDAALSHGAEGVGLLRTEFLFHESATLPDEEEQFRVYCSVARVFGDKPVTIRTLDIGGDKPLPSYPLPTEDNPFLGLRGIRLCLAHPQIFIPQLRALIRAGKEYPTLQIMLPMVSTLEEVRTVKTLIHAQAKLLGLTAENLPALGIMIEVPAAVMIADKLASEVDFFSIGTNDLTQYIMAADRGNSTVAKLVDYCNDAVINAIAMVCQAGRNNEIPVSMCGEMAGDIQQTARLLTMGIDKLSASPSRLPALKAAIRTSH